jgi:predicted dehydrogenase
MAGLRKLNEWEAELGQPIKIGIIGCGYWGPNHIRNFRAVNNCDVAAVADFSEARLHHVAGLYPDLKLTSDADEILSDGSIDAVVISTPTHTHADLVERSLSAGKHVLCEKPLCLGGDEADSLLALAERSQKVLMIGHVFLFNPGIQKLKELIDGEDLGRINYVTARRTNLGPIRSDVNASYDLASHDISILNWLFDDIPETLSATGASFVQTGIEDVVLISLQYPGGQMGNIHVSWLEPKKVREMTVVGNRQMAVWDDLNAVSPIAVYDKGAVVEQDYDDFNEFQRLSIWDSDIVFPKIPVAEPLRVQAEEFISGIASGRPVVSDGRFAVGVVKTLEAVETSIKSGGAPVALRK